MRLTSLNISKIIFRKISNVLYIFVSLYLIQVLEATHRTGIHVLHLVKAIISKEHLGAYLDAIPSVCFEPKLRAISLNAINHKTVVVISVIAIVTVLGLVLSRGHK